MNNVIVVDSHCSQLDGFYFFRPVSKGERRSQVACGLSRENLLC